ncbi:hypothetical protein EON81_13430 [bacterium]|nr:MAG: hypothetical protein EON81_13430 [bacterium]
MTDLQRVRLLLTDPDAETWEDTALNGFLDLVGNDAYAAAAAAALRAYAAYRSRLLSKIKDKDQEFERVAIKELLALAADYESRSAGSSTSILLESGDDTYAGSAPAWNVL